jgi:serine/threonine protein kinase/Flp pilus assembly protein TadD
METLSAAATVCSVCGERLNIKAQCLACLLRGGLDDPAEHCLPPPASLVFGNFEIARREDGSFWELGCGAMGVTYRAVDKVLHRTVALKVIETPAATGDSQVVRERFLREARAAAALKHPNVAGIFQFAASAEIDRCYYAMELVDGETLEALVRRDGPLKVELALQIAIQVTRALIAAAAQGLIHRDLKPGNIMLSCADTATAALEVKVIDFGLAKATNAVAETDLTHGGFIGTPSFASPEQFGSAPADARSDIYSLGVTLWYALTGQVPYPGKTIEEIRDRQKHTDLPIEQLNERKIPAALIDMLRRTLALDPTQRPASARELMEALESCRAKLAHRGGIRSFRKLPALIATLAIVAAIPLAFLLLRMVGTDRRAVRTGKQDDGRRSAASLPEKSIAVLPFENLSEEKENAFFAEGIQDELLSNLSKIKDLKVISRSSVMKYRSGITGNLKEIAQQLGVGNIVEGSVRRAGNRVRVSVQLIDAQTDRHVWTQNYDRTLADSITLQDELATEIAAALGATLSPQEKARVKAKPTNNPAAYDAYLRGRAFAGGSPFDKSNVERTIQSYQEAVKLDPSFVLAWARLSCAQSGSYWQGHDPSPARLAAAKDAADHALALDPDLPETHLALGYYRYFGQRDFTGGLAEFQQAEKGLPNNVDITDAIAVVQRRLGHWEEAIDEFRRVVELDPRNTNAYNSLAVTYRSLRRFPEALATVDRVLAWEPTNELALGLKASVFWATGDLKAVEPLLAIPGMDPGLPGSATVPVRGVQALFQRRYTAAIEILSSAVAAKTKRGEPCDDEELFLGLSQQRAGDVAAARATYEKAVHDFRRELEKVAPGSHVEAGVHAALGLAHAGLGEAASAIAEGQKAIAMVPTSKDPFEGADTEEEMADIYALLGDADHAIPILKRLLQIPYGLAITPALLRLDPIWDPIRKDPRFQKLCEEKSKP